MTALRRTEKEKTDYEKPEDRHPVTDPPTQKNETMQTQPCNLNICLCKKKNPQAPRIYKSSSLSLMRGSRPGECSSRFSSLTWRRCRQQRHWQRRQQRRRQGRSSSASSEGGSGSRSYSTGGADSSPMFLHQSIQANG